MDLIFSIFVSYLWFRSVLLRKKLQFFCILIFCIQKKAGKKVKRLFLNRFVHSLIFKIQKNGVYRLSAFDHYIAGKMFEQAPRNSFASKLWLCRQSFIEHPLNTYLHQAFSLLFLHQAGRGESTFFAHCRDVDLANKQLYYAMPEEMAARAFEHMLEQQPLKNSFLVSGCLKGPAATAGLYPPAELSQQLAHCWLNYFAVLGRALTSASTLLPQQAD